jgi:hypothetical protein
MQRDCEVSGLLALKGLITVSSPMFIKSFLAGLPNAPMEDFMGEDRFLTGEFSLSFSFFSAFLVDDFLADLRPIGNAFPGDSTFMACRFSLDGDYWPNTWLLMLLKGLASPPS